MKKEKMQMPSFVVVIHVFAVPTIELYVAGITCTLHLNNPEESKSINHANPT